LVQQFFMINLILLLLIFKASAQIEAKKPHDQLHLTENLFKNVCNGKLILFGDPIQIKHTDHDAHRFNQERLSDMYPDIG